ncbi:MAG TPA: site-2 protease family protein [Terriglobales bacterium]|nr:site-2 protease family protein [Terriglobales bacterium]
MEFRYVDIFFQVIVFLFAISVHESAHAWMANRCGDPTAKMLGRVTLNPIKHIDPFGTIILPAITLFSGLGMFGWAKPTPVTPENFRNPVTGDIWTTIAGPISNFILVAISFTLLALIYLFTPLKHVAVIDILQGGPIDSSSVLLPIAWFLFRSLSINVLLGIFNLIPVPPLDGSHILRHALPEPALKIYDTVGMFGIFILFLVGGSIVAALTRPPMLFLHNLLLKVTE